jgi:DNA-binding GntR family transcriptional regulator
MVVILTRLLYSIGRKVSSSVGIGHTACSSSPGIALRLAMERGDVQWETGVVAAYHLLKRTPVINDSQFVNEGWALRHNDFHRALIAACRNRCLEDVVQGLRDIAELHCRWYWAFTGAPERDVTAEHRELKDLTLARDVGPAIEALAYHINRPQSELIAYAHGTAWTT